MKIFIDAGHGGTDSGAVGNGLYEKTVNLNVAKRVEYHLKRHGQTVIMSRTGDTNPSLTARSSACNSNNCDVSVSIHANAFNGTAKGVETYTYGKGVNEIKLAECVHNQILSKKVYTLNRGIKQADFHMVRETKMAAILIEMAFIDNVDDAKLLKNNQEDFAVAITKGILQYFNLQWKDEVAQSTTPSSSTLYIVSVGAYGNKDNATKMVNEMKSKGIDACIHTCK